jgi:fimbrial chaperone protein
MPRITALFAAATMLVLPSASLATSVTPLNIEMTASGTRARSQIIVTNSGTEPVAIEPTVALQVLSETGKAQASPAGDDFLVLPTQALVAPGSSQTFRVQWFGGPDLSESRSYLITMNELPVRGITAKAGVRIILSFAVAVNVAPAGARGALNVVSSGIKTAGATRQPFVVLDNPTPRHALLKDAEITLSGDGWSKTLPPGSLQNVLGTGLVQPKRQRIFLLPVDVPANVRQLTVAVDYRPGK